ncbi:hypothetical protein Angca_008369 [Angiostrongylus cantonensis]|nr:hypothetical protein Angca_008369 [Angiostrongylus cantonensis]
MQRPHVVNASDLIHDVIGEAFRAAKLLNYTQALDEMDKPERWQTWTVGILIVSACSFSAPLGMLALPCLSKALYERIMVLLIALGIGALSGSSIFIMIPQAFHLTELDDFNYHSKSTLIVAALYMFFSVDRILQYALELRRREQVRRKVHTSTIVSIMNSPSVKKETSGLGSIREHRECSEENKNTRLRARLFDSSVLSALTCASETWSLHKQYERSLSVIERAVERTMLGVSRLTQVRDGIRNPGLRQRSKIKNAVLYVKQSKIRWAGHLMRMNDNRWTRVVSDWIPRDVKRTAGRPPTRCFKEGDDQISLSVKVIEKHVINPSKIEVTSVAYMIIFGSSANNFVDGMSMGAAFSDSLLRGLSIGFAVVSQQFPQELGTLAILINSGLGFRRAMLFNLIPIFLSYLGFICGVLLDNIDEGYDDYIFSISSGMYLYIFLGTLIPEIREGCNELMKVNMAESLLVTFLQFLGIISGICFMYYMSTMGDVEL